ncbi:MAG: ATP synthase F1 subunit delta [Bacillus thermozeamaize]|jgi:F-type H+-transporting ATPase subunit delta|uniref:ATP synthase subunit delta n=1 Tax=Bacillus thermozeamaize TaxID=230954 RepID=A0A1Y3PD08_9BACI|nr:MAG: ATP synthase F1 subunit delta [Bacillus thermozeamaize]
MMVAKRYAKAMFELALEQGRLDEIAADLTLIRDSIDQHAPWREWLANPQVSAQDKQSAVRQLYGEKVSPEVLHLLLILLKNRRALLISQVVRSYLDMVDEYKGVVHAHVSSAFPLTETEEEHLAASLKELTGKTEVVLHKETDPELIGGVLVRIGDRLYDGSVRGLLQRMEKQLVTA